MRQISPSVYVNVDSEGPNVGLIVTGAGNVLVDSPDAPTEAISWRREVEEKGEAKYLINTHGHPDHFMGNYFLPGVVIASSGARDAILKVNTENVLAWVKQIDPEGISLLSGYTVKVPTITFSSGSMDLYLGDQVIHLFHIGGHSPNLIGIYIPKEKVIFFGDNIVWKRKTSLTNAEPQKWLESLQLLSGMDVEIIVPGHGHNVCGKDYIAEQFSIVRQWVDAVHSAIKLGWTLGEAKERIKCPDPYQTSKRNPYTAKEVDAMIISHLYKYLTASKAASGSSA